MIKINLHGILGVEYGKEFNLYAQNAFFALKALDCINKGILNKIRKLQEKGLFYSIIVDDEWLHDKDSFNSFKKIKTIDIVPSVCGSGFNWGSALLTGLLIVGAAFTGGATLPAALALGALGVGVSLLMQAMTKQQSTQDANTQFVGGQTLSSASQSKSSAFSNVENVSAQNIPIPIGYGRMRVGTKIIQTSIKSYPTNVDVNVEFKQNADFNKLNLGFIS